MQPVDWGQAFQIVAGGVAAVFFIMTTLALTTHFMGKIFINLEKKKKAEEAAAKKAAEGEAKA